MKFYIQQKVFSISEKFDIYDQNENPVYYAQGELFAWGHKIHIYDHNENEVGFISQKILTFMPKFEIFMHDKFFTGLNKKFTFFEQLYELPEAGWVISGDFTAHEYTITDGQEEVAYMTKQWFTFGDCYEINVNDPLKSLSVILCMLAVDCAVCSQRS